MDPILRDNYKKESQIEELKSEIAKLRAEIEESKIPAGKPSRRKGRVWTEAEKALASLRYKARMEQQKMTT